jgi:phosphoenolpyruvate carboxykinase (GTP)
MKWIIERTKDEIGARETPIGYLPNIDDLDLKGLSIPKENLDRLLAVKPDEWQRETEDAEAFFSKFDGRIPRELTEELRDLRIRLKSE